MSSRPNKAFGPLQLLGILAVQPLRLCTGGNEPRQGQRVRLLTGLPPIGPDPPSYVSSSARALLHYTRGDFETEDKVMDLLLGGEDRGGVLLPALDQVLDSVDRLMETRNRGRSERLVDRWLVGGRRLHTYPPKSPCKS